MLVAAYLPRGSGTRLVIHLRGLGIDPPRIRSNISMQFMSALDGYSLDLALDEWNDLTGERLRGSNFGEQFERSVLKRILCAHFNSWRFKIDGPDSDSIWSRIDDDICDDCDEHGNCDDRCDEACRRYDEIMQSETDLHLEYLAEFFPKYRDLAGEFSALIGRMPIFSDIRTAGRHRQVPIRFIIEAMGLGCSTSCQQCANDRGPLESRWLYTRWPELLEECGPNKLLEWDRLVQRRRNEARTGLHFPAYNLRYLLLEALGTAELRSILRPQRIEPVPLDIAAINWATTVAADMPNVTYRYIPDPITATEMELLQQQARNRREEARRQEQTRDEFMARMNWVVNRAAPPPDEPLEGRGIYGQA